jgi:hypothetical protein
VISLYPKPHQLFDIGQQEEDEFERNADGNMVIWKRVEAPDLFDGPGAGRRFAERVYRVRDRKMFDTTSEFCGQMYSDQNPFAKAWKSELSPEKIAALQSMDRPRDDQKQIALSEASVSALHHWPQNGAPQNPEAWLMTAARRSLLDFPRPRLHRIDSVRHRGIRFCQQNSPIRTRQSCC